MISVPEDPKVNLQVLYWENQNKLVQSQNPDTIMKITKNGLNIYNLLPYDIQILNGSRQNTMVTIMDQLSLAPTIIDAFTAGPPDITKFPPTKSFGQFQEYMKKLRQLRWDVIRTMKIPEDNKIQLFQGTSDSLDDGELFQLAVSMKSEFMNLEYRNLDLTREDEYISQYQPATVVIPTTRQNMDLTAMEQSFIHLCKPHDTCIRKSSEPYWKDGMDYMMMTECVDYKLVALTAKTSWKKERQLLKDLNIQLPVGTSFYEWKIRKENTAAQDKKHIYEKCLIQMESLVLEGDVKDLHLAHKIAEEERKLIKEMRTKLSDFWKLQQEKLTISDGELFDLSMINPRCLPMVNALLKVPNKKPSMVIEEAVSESESSLEEWSGEWSAISTGENEDN